MAHLKLSTEYLVTFYYDIWLGLVKDCGYNDGLG